MNVAAGLQRVRDRMIAAETQAGRPPGSVRLVAVSKRQPLERVQAAYDAGQRDFGENYVQALVDRADALPQDIRWHMIGHLQTNKAKLAARAADMIQTVDSPRVARALAKAATRPIAVLLQVNIGNEPQKAGVAPESAAEVLRQLAELSPLTVKGLMAIPPPSDGTQVHFRALAALKDRLVDETGIALQELSMGMSADFEQAIACGATIVRVGTEIFGPRDA